MIRRTKYANKEVERLNILASAGSSAWIPDVVFFVIVRVGVLIG